MKFLKRSSLFSVLGKIILFYLIFYLALIGFFAAMLTVFYQTLDAKRPKWLLNESLIGSNPGNLFLFISFRIKLINYLFVFFLLRNLGLGFRPMPPPSNVESTLIWYKSNDKGNVAYWHKELDDFLKSTFTTNMIRVEERLEKLCVLFILEYDKSLNPHADNIVDCKQGERPEHGKVCDVKIDNRPCTPESAYNFNSTSGGPCIFLKLNKVS